MANDRRVARVASLIKREVSQMLMSEIKDDRVGAGMVSVTDVEVSGDLQHAKVFVSIYGTEAARTETMAGLMAATKFVRRELGQRIRLRRTPEILFREDLGVERGTRVISLMNQISAERDAKSQLADTATGEEFDDDFGEVSEIDVPAATEELE
ncbi:MAG: 30S ribosome-binding factor RbfA [Cyanobacteria bacterium P01_C01_bin.70]